MGLFKRKVHYDLTASVVLHRGADPEQSRARLEHAVDAVNPEGHKFDNRWIAETESAEGDVVLDGRWETNGQILNAESAVDAWRRSIGAIDQVQEVVRVVLGGTDGTIAERSSEQTVDALNRLGDEGRAALGPRVVEKDAP
ncbi:MAG TPA: hypothetical protein VMY88_07695 [Acidimicrobiales bacterium]|nr:hypothetical protein [Acidimicrobiales bacterium]